MDRRPILIHDARIVNEGVTARGYVLIEGDVIADTAPGDVPAELMRRDDLEKVDAAGRLLLPGVIDEHVHFRDPGLTHKADMATESRAAVAGGVTSFIDMPNTRPATVTPGDVAAKRERAAEVSVANYGFFIGATDTNLPDLLAADWSLTAGVKLFLGSSTGNMLVERREVIERIFREVPALIAVHAEDEATIKANREAVVARYGEDLPIGFHPVIRNHDACLKATQTAVDMARLTGARLHVLHVSTADELRLFESGPVAGKRITAETCPQYLLFTDEQYPHLGARIKCNPAIKRPVDRDGLRYAVANGLIDVIATDHAPHLLEEKEGTALTAVSGMPLVQFSLPVMLELSKEGVLSLEQVVEKMAHNPATLFGIEGRGFIRKGYYADLVMVDDDVEPYPVTPESVISRCGWSPLEGAPLSVRVDQTWVNGHTAYRHGIVFASARGMALRFSHK